MIKRALNAPRQGRIETAQWLRQRANTRIRQMLKARFEQARAEGEPLYTAQQVFDLDARRLSRAPAGA